MSYTKAKKVSPTCREQGHDWRESQTYKIHICMRCGIERSAVDRAFDKPEDDYTLICIWCGHQCSDQESLEEHEDECAP